MSKRSQSDAPPAKVGRPPAEIDADKVAELAFKGMTNTSIAILMDTSPQTIKRHFGDLCTQKRIERKLAIRETQWGLLTCEDRKIATTMAIWLGKNELDQTDKAHATIDQTVRTTKTVKLAPDPGEPNAS